MVRVLVRDFFYAVIIFAMLAAGVVGLLTYVTTGALSDGGENVDLFSDGTDEEIAHFNRTFNVQNDIVDTINETRSDLSKLKVNKPTDLITLPVAFVETSWDIVKLLIDSFSFMDSSIQGASAILGMPLWLPILIITLIGALLVFSIITLLFGKEI